MTQQMPNPIELYEAAAQGFRQALSAVKDDQMNSATPCALWNVQALINHNVDTTEFVRGALLENITIDSSDVIGHQLPEEGAVAAFDAGVAKVLDLIKEPGSAEKQITTPFGPMKRVEFLMASFMDLLIHRWDLSKGTGQGTTLDSGLVEVCYATFEPQMDGMRQMGIFGPAVQVPSGANKQNILIGMMGRNP